MAKKPIKKTIQKPKKISNKKQAVEIGLVIEKLQETCKLKLFSGKKSLKKLTRRPAFIHPGLALLGYKTEVKGECLILLSSEENKYLSELSPKELKQAAKNLAQKNIVAIVVLSNLTLPKAFHDQLKKNKIAFFQIEKDEPHFCEAVNEILYAEMTTITTIHANLVDVFGVGVLILGKSAIGKSESALELVARGHRLVADDRVEIFKNRENELMGKAPKMLKNFMEIRGIGLVDVFSVYGPTSVRAEKRIDIIVELIPMSDYTDGYERLGEDERVKIYLGIEVAWKQLPLYSGRNVAVVVELAAKDSLLKKAGINSAKLFIERQQAAINAKQDKNK